MKQFKGTRGQWTLCGRHIQAPNPNGGTLQLGQSFVMEVPRHENKFAEDVEGLANAQLFAASKQLLEALQESYEMLSALYRNIDIPLRNMLNPEGKKLWDNYLTVQVANEKAISAALD